MAANALRPVVADLQTKLARRYGDYGTHRAFCAIAGSDDLAGARAALADLSARMSDEAFEMMLQTGTTPAGLAGVLCLSIPQARRVVVDAAWTALCSRCGVAPRDGGIPTAFLRSQYDVSRFVEIRNGSSTPEHELQQFAEAFPDRDELVSREEFTAFCCGVSLKRATDKEYELHVLRSFNLDRAFGGAAQERLAADREFGRPDHQEGGMGRSHPLYQTTSSRVGVGASTGATQAVVQFHRAGRFTKENPMSGPSCSLNCSTTRGIV